MESQNPEKDISKSVPQETGVQKLLATLKYTQFVKYGRMSN